MNAIEIAALAAAAVARLRILSPALDGKLVLIALAVIVAGLVLLTSSGDLQADVLRAFAAFVASSGGVALMDRHAEKSKSAPAQEAR